MKTHYMKVFIWGKFSLKAFSHTSTLHFKAFPTHANLQTDATSHTHTHSLTISHLLRVSTQMHTDTSSQSVLTHTLINIVYTTHMHTTHMHTTHTHTGTPS